jgi:hypothetical protein
MIEDERYHDLGCPAVAGAPDFCTCDEETFPHCTIVERRPHYVTFWEQLDHRTRLYRYSDDVMAYPSEAERRLDSIQYYKMIAKVNAEDPFVGSKVHG